METDALRNLATSIAAVWRGDWPAFLATLELAKQHGTRAEVEEMLLQAVLFAGFPRVVTAFEHLNREWPTTTPPTGGAVAQANQGPAGRALFAAIYGKNDAAVRAMLQSCHGELHDFVLEAAYGRILTRPGLSAQQRELLACAALYAQGQERQFVAHARGARQFGASLADLQEILAAAGCPAAGTATWLRAVP